MTPSARSDCNREDLTLLYYRDLPTDRQRQLEEHLAGCPDCAAWYRQLACDLDAVPRPELGLGSADLARFAARLDRRGRRTGRLPAWGGVLAAGAALGLALVVTRSETPAPRQPTAAAQLAGNVEVLQDMELLRNLDLLQNLALLEELEKAG